MNDIASAGGPQCGGWVDGAPAGGHSISLAALSAALAAGAGGRREPLAALVRERDRGTVLVLRGISSAAFNFTRVHAD